MKKVQNKLKKYKLLHRELKLRRISKHNIRNKNISIKENIVISGFYRGGTTWIAEILSIATGKPIIWEPFNKGICEQRDQLNIGWKFKINEDEPWQEGSDYLNKINTGQILTNGLTAYAKLTDLKKTDSYILKFCRLNSSLPWYIKNFPDTKCIFLIRHPLAVIASQYNHRAWDSFSNTFPNIDGKYNGFFKEYEHILNNLNSKIEILAADWCLDHLTALLHEQNNKIWLTVSYEKMLIDPDNEFARIAKFLNIEKKLFYKQRLETPSKTTEDKSKFYLREGMQLYQWKSKLSESQIQKAMKVLSDFGLSKFFNTDFEPNYNQLYNED